MITFLARFIAGILLLFVRPWAFFYRHRWLLAFGAATILSSALSTLATVLLLHHTSGDASAQATYISANGTTATGWLLGGPSGPGLQDDAGNVILFAESDGGTTGSSAYLVGGSAVNHTRSQGGAAVVQGGPATGFSGNGGPVFVTGGGLVSGSGSFAGSVTISGGSSLSDAGDIGGGGVTIQSGSSSNSPGGIAGLIQVHAGAPNGTQDGFMILKAEDANGQGQIDFDLSGVTMFELTNAGFVPAGNNSGGSFSCGQGGTIVAPTPGFYFGVNTSPLTSNCIIDFSANPAGGFYIVDLSEAVLNATFGIEFKNGANTKTYLSTNTSNTLALVSLGGSGSGLAVQF